MYVFTKKKKKNRFASLFYLGKLPSTAFLCTKRLLTINRRATLRASAQTIIAYLSPDYYIRWASNQEVGVMWNHHEKYGRR